MIEIKHDTSSFHSEEKVRVGLSSFGILAPKTLKPSLVHILSSTWLRLGGTAPDHAPPPQSPKLVHADDECASRVVRVCAA